MNHIASNHNKNWVQLNPNFEHYCEPTFFLSDVQAVEPINVMERPNEYHYFCEAGVRGQSGFTMGSLNPIRFMGSRAYIRRMNMTLPQIHGAGIETDSTYLAAASFLLNFLFCRSNRLDSPAVP